MIDMRKEMIERALAEFIDPYTGQDLITAKTLKNIEFNEGEIQVHLLFAYPLLGIKSQLEQEIAGFLQQKTTASNIKVKLAFQVARHQVQHGLAGIKPIKNIIAVGSGKGGVGKSTVSVNLALALSQEGAKVGLLDADIYGPSQPLMLGSFEAPKSTDKKTILPVERYNLQTMSIGYLVDTNAPMIWRGPMVSGALQQLLNDTQWQDLDYLIIDLPPGTGDIQLTLAQKIPVAGAVIVTTPQDLSLLDARRAIGMFNKVNIPVLGIVENMSMHTCSHCGHVEHIFGEGGANKMAEEYKLDVLGSLPLDAKIRAQTDQGTPPVAAEPDGPVAQQYRDIARKVAAKLSMQAKRAGIIFPKIIVENS